MDGFQPQNWSLITKIFLMKNNLNISKEAIKDLDAIKKYILSETSDLELIKNTIKKVIDGILNLSEFPRMGKTLSNFVEIENDYRYLLCGSYRIFYQIDDEEIYVIRILHAKRNYLKVLFSEESKEQS